jgi:hypothetical protein
MAKQTILTVAGNTAPPLELTCERSGVVIDLTGCTVELIITQGRTIRNAGHQGCTITSSTGGIVTYVRQAGDTPTVGSYVCDLRVTYGDATIEILYDQLVLKCRKPAGA